MWVLHKGLPFVQDCLQINIDWVSDMVKGAIKEQDEKKAQLDELDTSSDEIEMKKKTIDTPLRIFFFGTLNKVHKFEGHEVSLRILHNIYNTFKNDEDRIKSYSFGSFGVNGEALTVDPNKIDFTRKLMGKKIMKNMRLNLSQQTQFTLSDKIQLVTRFYGTPEEIHKNFDFVHAMGI